MPTFSAQTLIDRAAAIADMHDSFVQPVTWLAWINQERLALEQFCARSGWILNRLVARDFSWSLFPYVYTDTFMAVVGVWELDSSGRMRQLVHTNVIDIQRQDSATGPITGPATNWSVTLDNDADFANFTLFPRPTSGTYRIIFLDVPTQMASTASNMTLPLGIEEWIVLKIARRALIKEDSDTAAIDRLISEEEQRIEEIGWAKAVGEVPAVRNSDIQNRAWSGQIVYPAPISWLWR